MAASYAAGNPDPQAWLHGVIDAACHSYRDQYRTDALRTAVFIRRIPPAKYAGILAAAEQVPELAAYLARLDESDWVWLGSAETQGGVAALVGLGLLTQADADALLHYPLPELPQPPEGAL
jgi:hypothetical protein